MGLGALVGVANMGNCSDMETAVRRWCTICKSVLSRASRCAAPYPSPLTNGCVVHLWLFAHILKLIGHKNGPQDLSRTHRGHGLFFLFFPLCVHQRVHWTPFVSTLICPPSCSGNIYTNNYSLKTVGDQNLSRCGDTNVSNKLSKAPAFLRGGLTISERRGSFSTAATLRKTRSFSFSSIQVFSLDRNRVVVATLSLTPFSFTVTGTW